MNIKKSNLIGAISCLAVGLFLKDKLKDKTVVKEVIIKTVEEVKETFGGVSMEKLNELAKEVYHGVKVVIDEYGFLVLHYKSNSGKTTHKVQMEINELGELVNLGGYHPNQWKSSADDFVKIANNNFKFKE